jgi:hypothetical protein
MKSSAVLIWTLFGIYLFGQTTPSSPKLQDTIENSLNGEFVGMEEIKDYEPGKKWFHENRLLIKNGEAVSDKTPVVIVKNKKIYSASDGGFITYRGRFFQRGTQLLMSLRPFESDYIVFPIAVRDPCDPYSKVTVVAAEMTQSGLVIDGVLYRSKALSRQKRERLSEWLQSEPMEYNGECHYRPDLKLPACQ